MEIMVFHTLKVVATAVISSFCCYLVLLFSRTPLCYDIEQSTGRHVFKNKRKPHKEYPNYLRRFFLWDYRQHIRGWHYALFLLDISSLLPW